MDRGALKKPAIARQQSSQRGVVLTLRKLNYVSLSKTLARMESKYGLNFVVETHPDSPWRDRKRDEDADEEFHLLASENAFERRATQTEDRVLFAILANAHAHCAGDGMRTCSGELSLDWEPVDGATGDCYLVARCNSKPQHTFKHGPVPCPFRVRGG